MAELEHRFPPRQVLEAVLAEPLQRRSSGQSLAAQVVGDPGYERLTTVTCGKQPRHVVEWWAEVVAVADFCGSRVQCHPGADRRAIRPTLYSERKLRGECGLDGLRRSSEGRAESIPSGLEDVTSVRGDSLSYQSVVTRQRRPHRVMLSLPEPRAALDVGEQKRDGACRQRRPGGTLPGDHSTFYASRQSEKGARRSKPGESCRLRNPEAVMRYEFLLLRR